jgi:hypothetical protein
MLNESYSQLFSIEGNPFRFVPVQTLGLQNQTVYAILVVRDDELPSHYLMTPLEDLFWHDSLVTLVESIEWYFQDRLEKNENAIPMKYSDVGGNYQQLEPIRIIEDQSQSLGSLSWTTFDNNTFENRQRTSLSKTMSVCIKAIELT